MSTQNMTMVLCQVLNCAAQYTFWHSLTLACKPVTARNLPLKYAIGTVPCRTVPNAPHSLQVIDYKVFFELCNCAPLKGVTNAAQYGNSSPLCARAEGEINHPSSGTNRGEP